MLLVIGRRCLFCLCAALLGVYSGDPLGSACAWQLIRALFAVCTMIDYCGEGRGSEGDTNRWSRQEAGVNTSSKYTAMQ